MSKSRLKYGMLTLIYNVSKFNTNLIIFKDQILIFHPTKEYDLCQFL